MSAKTYVIVDQQTNSPVGLFTCDEDPDIAMSFGGAGQRLVDDPQLVAQLTAQAVNRPDPQVADPFADLPQL